MKLFIYLAIFSCFIYLAVKHEGAPRFVAVSFLVYVLGLGIYTFAVI